MKIEVIDFGYKNLPFRAHRNDAGADVYIMRDIRILSQMTVAIPLGFGLKLPDGYAAFIYPRSSLSKRGIVCQLPPIDSGYRGEIHAIVTNTSNETCQFKEGDRIGQLVVLPIVIADFVTDEEEGRGAGAFGSTGR